MAKKCALTTCFVALAIVGVAAKEESCAMTGDCFPSEVFDNIPSEAGLSLLQTKKELVHAVKGEETEIQEHKKEDAFEGAEPEVEEDKKEYAFEGEEPEVEEDMKEDAIQGEEPEVEEDMKEDAVEGELEVEQEAVAAADSAPTCSGCSGTGETACGGVGYAFAFDGWWNNAKSQKAPYGRVPAKISTMAECAADCDALAGCVAFSIAGKGYCWLYASMSSEHKTSTSIACLKQKKAATEYSDLGSGKCLYQAPTPECPPPPPPPACPPKPKLANPKYSWKKGQGHTCRAMCDASASCGGYSVSIYNNCLLWNDSDLKGGGRPWGNCDCLVKDGAGYKNLGSGKCLYQPPTPECPPPPPPPPCPPKPKAVNPKYSYKSRQGSKCRALCDASASCGGYSVSVFNNCLLWNDPGSDLIAGGKPWGDCKCYAKK